jgi:uncharacterized protein (DUF1697 family)
VQRTLTGYAAFLRGINVGGHNIIKMDQLRRVFVELGFEEVKVYIQSGNVTFRSIETNSEAIAEKLESSLRQLANKEIDVMVRTTNSLQAMRRADPFKGAVEGEALKLYVSFLRKKPQKTPALPTFSTKKDIELLEIHELDTFSLSHKVNGSFGFPNEFVERLFGTRATSRNWKTILKMLSN